MGMLRVRDRRLTRSRKKTPIAGITRAESEKDDKARAHRQERAHVRRLIESDPDAIPDPKAFGDPWSAAKDGKHYFGDHAPKLRRK